MFVIESASFVVVATMEICHEHAPFAILKHARRHVSAVLLKRRIKILETADIISKKIST